MRYINLHLLTYLLIKRTHLLTLSSLSSPVPPFSVRCTVIHVLKFLQFCYHFRSIVTAASVILSSSKIQNGFNSVTNLVRLSWNVAVKGMSSCLLAFPFF